MSGELLLCHDSATFYVDSVCFTRHGYFGGKGTWTGRASIWSLAEDLGLARVRELPAREFTVDDFGNLRLAHLHAGERQWVYPEEWVPRSDEDDE